MSKWDIRNAFISTVNKFENRVWLEISGNQAGLLTGSCEFIVILQKRPPHVEIYFFISLDNFKKYLKIYRLKVFIFGTYIILFKTSLWN